MKAPQNRNERIPSDIFHNPRNVQVGMGRILWGTQTTVDGVLYPAGWVIPGGRRTNSYSEALLAAQWIDRYIRLRIGKKMPQSDD